MDAAKEPARSDATTTDSRATALLKRAHESHYRWPATFRGFDADVTVTTDAGRSQARLRVMRGGGSAVRRTAGDELSPASAAEVIALASRLTTKSYDDLDGRYGGRFRSRLDRGSGVAVVLVGDPRHTVRWIRDDRLVETEFDFDGAHHTIGVVSTAAAPDGRWLPAVTWERREDADGEIRRDVDEEWTTSDGVVLPLRRSLVAAGSSPRRVEVVLSGHRVLTNR
jgi:hypothetical protein